MESTELTGQPIRILVVDDDPAVIHALTCLLKSAGYDARVASSGQACLNRLHETLPDLVLLDVALPDMDGLEVCRQIKADPRLADTSVVLLSSMRTDSDKQAEGLEAGADGYIDRPVGNRELLARVQALVRVQAPEPEPRESQTPQTPCEQARCGQVQRGRPRREQARLEQALEQAHCEQPPQEQLRSGQARRGPH